MTCLLHFQINAALSREKNVFNSTSAEKTSSAAVAVDVEKGPKENETKS